MTNVETSPSPLPDQRDLGKVIVKGQQVLGFYGARKQRTSLSVQTKLDVIKYAEENPTVTQNKIATHFGIDRTTVSKVLKRKAQLKVCEPDGKSAFGDNAHDTNEQNEHSSDSAELNDSSIQNSLSSRSRRSSANSQRSLRSNTAAVPKHLKHDFHLSSLAMKDTTQDLYDKCESWFMKQKFTTASKKHEKDIIAYSCLISPLPLSVENCGRIISAKFVKDEAFQWLYKQLAFLDPGSQSMTSLEGRGEELLTKYLQEELMSLNKKLSKMLPGSCPAFSAPDVRRVWLQYVNPKLHLFAEAEQQVIESIETHAHSRPFAVMPPAKKLKLPISRDPNNSQQLVSIMPSGLPSSLFSSTSMPQPLMFVPSTPISATSPLSASSHLSMTSPHCASAQFLLPVQPPIDTRSLASTSPVLTEASRSESIENGQVLDLSTNDGQSKGLDLSRNSDDRGSGIRGSRKRKMNSNPVRITQQDVDESLHAENGEIEPGLVSQKSSGVVDTTKHPQLMGCLNSGVYSSSKSNHVAMNGYSSGKSEHPVIEIIPDRYRSGQPRHSGLLRQKLTTNCSSANNCDNNNLHSDISNNNKSQAIHGILDSVSSLSEQFAKFQKYVKRMEQSLKDQKTESITCTCDCQGHSQLEKRISNLEEKCESIQTTLDKLSKAVMDDTK